MANYGFRYRNVLSWHLFASTQMGISQKRGPLFIPHMEENPLKGTPKKGTPIFGNPQMEKDLVVTKLAPCQASSIVSGCGIANGNVAPGEVEETSWDLNGTWSNMPQPGCVIVILHCSESRLRLKKLASANKQANKQTNKRTNSSKQASKQRDGCADNSTVELKMY